MGVKIGGRDGRRGHGAVSQSLKKMEDGLRLGASEYYATSDPDTFTKLRGSFDLILNTVSANLDMGDYLEPADARRHPRRTRACPSTRWRCRPFALVVRRGAACPGSMIGGIAETQEMLDFCAEHDVTPEIEVIEPDYINEAYERVLASDVRYRFVIDTATLRALTHRRAPRARR